MDARTLGWIPILAVIAACGRDNSPSDASAPGGSETAKTKLLEAGADVLQSKAPLRALNAYLDGFHFRAGNMRAQMEAHHYCGHLNEDVIQCALFDGNGADAKLVGVEYIVSAAVFAELPAAEKHSWHSHVHEVRSGQLIAPGIPDVAEHELMKKIAGTYGKTWHTWHNGEQLPIGSPSLMMGFTADGQADESMIAARDARFDVSSAEKRQQRADIAFPPVDPDADRAAKP
jgi:hypothetical protein